MTLIRRLRRFATITDLQDKLIASQEKLIALQQHDLQQLRGDLQKVHIQYLMEMRGLACAWMIAQERPEIDMREELVAMERVLAERQAVHEEHSA